MKVKTTIQMRLPKGGKVDDVPAGTVLELPNPLAVELIHHGRAIAAVDAPAKPAKPAGEAKAETPAKPAKAAAKTDEPKKENK